MRKIKIIGFLFFASLFASCGGDGDEGMGETYSKYKPVLMDTSSFYKSVNFGPAREINSKGTIYADGTNMFVVEHDLGVHFLDNTNPANPIETGFLNVIGCRDLSIVKNTMYVNHEVDMLAIDITNPKNPVVVKRIRNIFPMSPTPDGYPLPTAYSKIPANCVIVGWK